MTAVKKVRLINSIYFGNNPPESRAKRAKKRVDKVVDRIFGKIVWGGADGCN